MLRLYDFKASANCYKVRLLLAQLGRPLRVDRGRHLRRRDADRRLRGQEPDADDAGIDVQPYENLRAWLERVQRQPGYMNDLEPYPPNAAPGAGRSLYD